MRAYFFTNLYLSSIQQGIQPLHVMSNMFVKYGASDNNTHNMLYDWAQNHKTVICLNGGYSQTLAELRFFFDDSENPFPWDYFCEGDDALDGALTSVGIVLPEKIYNMARLVREKEINTKDLYAFRNYPPTQEEFSLWEIQFIERLTQFSLAH